MGGRAWSKKMDDQVKQADEVYGDTIEVTVRARPEVLGKLKSKLER